MKLSSLVVAVLCVFVIGCGGGDSSSGSGIGIETVAGYGRPNTWAEPIERALLDLAALAEAGTGIYTIELGGARDFSRKGQAEWLSIVSVSYPTLVEEARRLGVTVLVSIANDNSGSGKFGQNGPKLSGQKSFLKSLVDVVLAAGPDGIIVQPVAEVNTSGGRWFQGYAVSILFSAGYELAYNGDGRPEERMPWAMWRTWHPFDISEVPSGDLSDCIVVGDTERFIRQTGHNTLDGPGDADALFYWGSRMKECGAAAAVYYAFKFSGPTDTVAIKAISEGVRQ